MKKLLVLSALPLWLGWTVFAGEPKSPGVDAKAAFARLGTLVGDWETATSRGKVHVKYELISAGTALVERVTFESNVPPMETIYHLDGDRLLLTHYCMLGNQPRMQARFYDAEAGELRFEFLDITNLANSGAGHMHNATFRFTDENRLAAEWEFFEEGKLKNTEAFEFVRVP
jgi:hypothetical protein